MEKVQISVSSLRPEVNREDYIAALKELKKWLSIQKGFVSYEVYEDCQYWVDKIVYKNNEYAHNINLKMLQSEIGLKLLELAISESFCIVGKQVSI